MSHAFALLTRPFLCFLALATIASCGGGGVSGPAPVTDPSRITILPETATLYSGVPTTFVVTGGTGSYIVSSSNQTVVPVSGSINGNNLVVTPNNVVSETAVTLTVRDTGTTPIASATLTVRPGTVSNEITVTATSTQGLACAPAICSGGDAEVAVTLSQAGAPLIGRTVRFDAVTGDYRFITSTSGSTVEVLETSATVVTDQTGRARARIRVLPNAPNQTALLQATDTASGAFQRASFVIAQATGTSPGFIATPSSITFQGVRQGECAGSNISALFYVFGGTPPYNVSNTFTGLSVRPELVTSSGGSFTVTPNGTCMSNIPVVIRDAAGRTTTVAISNIEGTIAVPALAASPSTVNLSSCDAAASIQIAGGRGSYFVASGSDALVASVSGSTVTVRRRSPSGPAPATGTIGISDGTSVVSVTVTLSGAALGTCPTPATPALAASPTSVTLNDCTGVAQVIVSGGSGTYTASSSSGSVSTSVSGNVVSIRRAVPSSAFAGGTVTISDGSSSVAITVTGAGAGAGACGSGTGTLATNPTAVTLTSCTTTEFVQVSGGSGTYTAIPSTGSLTTSISGSVLSIRRTNPSPAFTSPTATVTVSDGTSSIAVTVSPAGEGAGACPTPVMVSPDTVQLKDCTTAEIATISGGSGNYTATSSTTSLTVSLSGNVLSIRRTNPSPAFSGGTITVSDGSSTDTVTVTASGTAAGACSSSSTFNVQPTRTDPLTSCFSSPVVTVSGGSGSYTASSSTTAIEAIFNGNLLTIRRRTGTGPIPIGDYFVFVSDGSASSIRVTVPVSSGGEGAC